MREAGERSPKSTLERKHIGRSFREINWRKVDGYQAGAIVGGRFDFKGDGMN